MSVYRAAPKLCGIIFRIRSKDTLSGSIKGIARNSRTIFSHLRGGPSWLPVPDRYKASRVLARKQAELQMLADHVVGVIVSLALGLPGPDVETALAIQDQGPEKQDSMTGKSIAKVDLAAGESVNSPCSVSSRPSAQGATPK
jgi:hypothetical protein